jgi:hypothetical protein
MGGCRARFDEERVVPPFGVVSHHLQGVGDRQSRLMARGEVLPVPSAGAAIDFPVLEERHCESPALAPLPD